jgi:hypothetical protein
MQTNQKMRGYLSHLQSDESALSPELLSILSMGFVEEKGCVLLASGAHASIAARDAGQDDTGYECYINHLHVKSLAEAVEFARRLKSGLAERFTYGFVVIVSFDGQEATVRFHKNRAGQRWIDSNLEGYAEEGIAVLD